MNKYIAIILGIIAIAILAIYFIWTKMFNNETEETTEETKTQPQKEKKPNDITVWKIALGTFIGIIAAHFTIEIIEAIEKFLLLQSFM